jgi:hypothetical protein
MCIFSLVFSLDRLASIPVPQEEKKEDVVALQKCYESSLQTYEERIKQLHQAIHCVILCLAAHLRFAPHWRLQQSCRRNTRLHCSHMKTDYEE